MVIQNEFLIHEAYRCDILDSKEPGAGEGSKIAVGGKARFDFIENSIGLFDSTDVRVLFINMEAVLESSSGVVRFKSARGNHGGHQIKLYGIFFDRKQRERISILFKEYIPKESRRAIKSLLDEVHTARDIQYKVDRQARRGQALLAACESLLRRLWLLLACLLDLVFRSLCVLVLAILLLFQKEQQTKLK